MPVEGKSVNQSVPIFNKDIVRFVIKLIALVIIWECSYYFILIPTRIPDKGLTDFITSGTTHCLNLFSSATSKYTWKDFPETNAARIFNNGKYVFYIADICNGLSLLAIYCGFIILLPYPVKRKIVFCVGGIIALTIANIIRCVSLYWIFRHHADLFELNHHYVFTIFMYLLIFLGWILFTKKTKPNEVR
jgi:exosortase/archaeosortase family protein